MLIAANDHEQADPVTDETAMRRCAADGAVREWLDTQARVVTWWRDLLVESGGAPDLVATLDDHAAFLRGASAG